MFFFLDVGRGRDSDNTGNALDVVAEEETVKTKVEVAEQGDRSSQSRSAPGDQRRSHIFETSAVEVIPVRTRYRAVNFALVEQGKFILIKNRASSSINRS